MVLLVVFLFALTIFIYGWAAVHFWLYVLAGVLGIALLFFLLVGLVAWEATKAAEKTEKK